MTTKAQFDYMATLRLGLSSFISPIRYGMFPFIVAIAVAISVPRPMAVVSFLLILSLSFVVLLGMELLFDLRSLKTSDFVVACATFVLCPIISLISLDRLDVAALQPSNEVLTTFALAACSFVIVYVAVSGRTKRDSNGPGDFSLSSLIPIVLALATIWIWCAVVTVNRLTDVAPALTSKVHVTGAQVVRTGFRHHYEVTMAPWQDGTNPGPVYVSKPIYVAALRHQDLCVRLHPGNLGMPWYQLTLCI